MLGDFNDLKDSAPIKTIVGRGRTALFDTRPAERSEMTATNSVAEPESIAWTEYYREQDSYSRIDYLLISRRLRQDWREEDTCIPRIPGWRTGSDHRPIVAGFEEE